MTAACPLVTPYTTELGIKPELLGKLHTLRHWDMDAGLPPFKWPASLRKNFLNGESIVLRGYQIQAALHLATLPRFFFGDDVGLGKTVSAIAACCYIKERHPEAKVIVVTTKSTAMQWAFEFERFSTLRPYVMQDSFRGLTSYPARFAQLETFFASDKIDVMVCKYASLAGRRKKVKSGYDEDGIPVQGGKERISQEIKKVCEILKPHRGRIILIFDEAHRAKGTTSLTRKLVLNMSKQATSVWALTATAIKNNLAEMYSIASAIGIRPLGYMGDFSEEFCIFREIYVGGGRRVPIIVGYKNVPKFKEALRPFFLGRSQKQVKEPLPVLSTIYHPIDLDEEQRDLLLNQIPSGEFQLPPALIEIDGQVYEKERDPDNLFTQLSVYQLVANHPCLLDPKGEDFYTKKLSPKEEYLLDLLSGDLLGEKVVVFTKLRRWIDRMEKLSKDGHFTDRKVLRITGAESERKREENKALFQDPDSGYDLIFINEAGTEGINLQSAAHMVALDVPWGWGSLLQLVGRIVRMASPHSACTFHVFAARGTVDEYAIETLRGKKGVFEKILGESYGAGLLDDRAAFDLASGMEAVGSDEEFRSLMRAHVKKVGLKRILGGAQLAKAIENEDYRMTFEHRTQGHKEKAVDKHEELFKKWGGETVL